MYSNTSTVVLEYAPKDKASVLQLKSPDKFQNQITKSIDY